MSRFFSKVGVTLTDRIRNLAPTESVILELTSVDGYQPAMKSVSSVASQLGYKIKQESMKGVSCDVNSNSVTPLIKVTRES